MITGSEPSAGARLQPLIAAIKRSPIVLRLSERLLLARLGERAQIARGRRLRSRLDRQPRPRPAPRTALVHVTFRPLLRGSPGVLEAAFASIYTR